MYIPRKGDFVSYFFGEQSGHEQQGRRPALVVSSNLFNKTTGYAIVCPITRTDRGYPFHVSIPSGGRVSGMVMVDNLKSIDYRDRKISFLEQSSTSLLEEVCAMVDSIIN